MSSSISRTDLNISSIAEGPAGIPEGQTNTPEGQTSIHDGQQAPEKASGHLTSSRDAVQLSFTAQIQRLKSNGVTPEMIAAELDLPVETINSYLQSGPFTAPGQF